MPLGSFPSVFYADWYDNFGYIGAFFSMFFLGFVMQILDIKMMYFITKYKSVIILGIYIFMLNFFSQYALTSYVGILFDTHLVFPIVIGLFLFTINKFLLKKEQSA